MDKIKKIYVFLLLAVMALAFCTGCGSSDDAGLVSADALQDILSENQELTRKNDKLKSENSDLKKDIRQYQQDQTDSSSDASLDASTRATRRSSAAYLSFIGRSNFTQIRFFDENSADGRYIYFTDHVLCNWLSNMASMALIDTNSDYSDFRTEVPRYSYTLYNEDHSVCRMRIYRDSRVIFDNINGYVYYIPDIMKLGRAMSSQASSDALPNESMYNTLYLADLVYDTNEVYSDEAVHRFITSLKELKLSKEDSAPADVESSSLHEYIFRTGGDTYLMEEYSRYISITKNNSEVTWYDAGDRDLSKIFLNNQNTE